MGGDPTLRKLSWAVPAAAFLVLALLAMLFSSPPSAPRPGSTLDAKEEGVRAAYLLLQGLGYDVAVSKRVVQGNARWVLFPQPAKGEPAALDERVRGGSRVLLADEDPNFAGALGLVMDTEEEDNHTIHLTIDNAPLKLAPGERRIRPRVRPDRVWPEGSNEPVAAIYRHGRGEVWVLYHPEFLRNDRLRDADNAVVVCRLAEAFAGSEKIYFDEFFHGMRERPGAGELLLRPPALWVTLQGLALLGVLLWRFLPRFGDVEAPPQARRRSKDEFVDALANLLEQKGAYDEAFRTVRDALAREMERSLGLPPESSANELAAAALGGGPDAAALARELGRDHLPRQDALTYVRALNEMERLRRVFLHERHDQ
jgi:hypothetical protein